MRISTYAKDQGFANKAYDGIHLEKGEYYKVSFYARCVDYQGSTFTVDVRKEGKIYAKGSVEAIRQLPYMPFVDAKPYFETGIEEIDSKHAAIRAIDPATRSREHAWNYYELELIAEETVSEAGFVISLDVPGVVEFDLISMLPASAVAGVFRKDLFEALKDIGPGFIRFPGGCIVEGISLENRYQWKQTVGDLKDRKYMPNLWAFDDDRNKDDLNTMRPTTSHYGQSYGIGFYEYFLLCELLGAKPLPVLAIGVACQFRTTELFDIDSDGFKACVQDALDLIEFANGPVDSKWGSLRAKMGHPEAFGMDMLAIGNEQWETDHVDLYERYRRFEAAIHAVYPEMKLIGTAGPFVNAPIFDAAWDFYREEAKKNPQFCYAVDEHYYVPPKWLYEHVNFYDNYPRDVAVFAGEYAAHVADRENTMESALAEAAFLTGVEKNAGVVKLASYAPLFNRIGLSQWKPDLIWFDGSCVYKTPNYYVQMLYANHVGDYTLLMDGQEEALRAEGIYVSLSEKCTEDGQCELILKAVNTKDEAYMLELEAVDNEALSGTAQTWTLKRSGEKHSELPEPSEVICTEIELDGKLKLEAKTMTVMRYVKQNA